MPFGLGSTVNNAHYDYSGAKTEMGVIGTLGTSDVKGTSLTLPFAIDAATGAAWGKEIGTPSVNIAGGTIITNTNLIAASTDYYPMYNQRNLGGGSLSTDPSGALEVHGAITTDEGIGRVNFTGGTLITSPGTATFVNASTAVTGTGFSTTEMHFLDYIKLNADSETAWKQISFINSDTSITLYSNYTGAGGTGLYNLSPVATSTGAQGTITVASGQMTMNLGTNTSAASAVYRATAEGLQNVVLFTTALSISQRVANQDIYVGLESAIVSPIKYFARFHFTSTVNTTVITETGYNPTTDPTSSETESNTITLPNSAVTSSVNTYRIDFQPDSVTFFINGIQVSQHTARLPHIPSLPMNADIRGVNSGTVTATNIVVNFISSQNYDLVRTYAYNPYSSLNAVGPTASGSYLTGAPVPIGGTDSGGTIRTPLVTTAGRFSSDGTVTGGTIQNLNGGTITALATGTINVGTFVMPTGTLTTIAAGTQNTLGTVNVIQNAGTIQGGTINNLATGTINALAAGTITAGTLTNLVSGTINAIAAGTITTGTVSVTVGTIGGKAASGVVAVANPVQIAGTDAGGTIYSPVVTTAGVMSVGGSVTGLGTAPGLGTLTNVGSLTNFGTGKEITNLVGGTLLNSGSSTGVGTITNIGSLTNVGTIKEMTNLVGGTLLNSGSSTGVGVVTSVTNIVSGTLLNSGTTTGVGVVTSVTNLAAGTITSIVYGTVQVDPKPTPVKTTRTTYGTTGTTGAAVFGTLVASVGNGTFAYITGYQIVVMSGTVDCAIVDGTFNQATLPAGGTNMITRGLFPQGAGIARDLTVPYVSGTGGTICYWMGGAGTAYFQVDYWAST